MHACKLLLLDLNHFHLRCVGDNNEMISTTLCLFDNILITDDPEYAKKFAEETWGKHKDVCRLIISILSSFFKCLATTN